MINICKNCNQTYKITNKRFSVCTPKCAILFAGKKSIGLPKPGAKKGSIFSCINCKKEFYVQKYRIKKGEVKYCSRSCLAKKHLGKYRPIHGFQPIGRPKHKYKYIYINGKQIREHRYIMEQHLGRKLERWEHVHHINDDSFDNRLENLIVLSNSQHQKEEHKFRKKIISSS